MEALAQWAELSVFELTLAALVVFAAGVVRGFSGFALSALTMASLALIIPPVQLIPVCWVLEMTASLLMVRGGVRDWDRRIVVGLVGGGLAGWPIGLALTTTLPVETSKALALCVILALAVLQLARVRLAALATTAGLWISGLAAGLASGLAMVGGMVVALYVLSQDRDARVMRGSLVMYLFIGSVFALVWLVGFGVFDGIALRRGLVLAPIVALGVLAGRALFRPSLERYYKPFCLVLLMALAGWGLVRLAP